MIISYGTKKYYETELAKAKFTETASKKARQRLPFPKAKMPMTPKCCNAIRELIENATKETERAQKSYDEFIQKEEQKKEEQNNG